MKIQSWYVCGVVGASFFLGACSLIPQQNVSVQLKIKPPSAQLSAALARSALTDKSSPTASARLRTDFCYAINVTGDHPLLGSVTQDQAALCQKGGPRPGLVKGLYKVGDVAVLEVPAGAKRRFDLLAFPMQGTSCEGSFELSQAAPGDFSAKLGGTVIPTGSVVAATAVQDVITDSTVELIEQTDTTLAFGARAGCLKPEVTSVQVSGTTFTINGSNLDTVSSVKFKDMTVPFEIISKTAAVIQAKALSSLSVVLGQTYNLLVSNALGDTTVQVNVSLADGSVAPEKLDMTKVWPFPIKISLNNSMISLSGTGISPSSISDYGNLFDSNHTTYIDPITVPYTTSNAELVIDLGSVQSGTVFLSGESFQTGGASGTSGQGVYLYSLYSSLSDPTHTVSSAMGSMCDAVVRPFTIYGIYASRYLKINLTPSSSGMCTGTTSSTFKLYELRVTGSPF